MGGIRTINILTWRRYLMALAGVGALYYLAARLGFLMAFENDLVTPIWPPAGLALAAFLLLGYRICPGIFLGALLANLNGGETLFTVVGISVGNTLAGMVGLFLLRRIPHFDPALVRLKDVLGLAFLGGVGGSVVSATNGVANLAVSGAVPWSSFFSTWWVWWVGDTMGVLLVAPFLLTWINPPRARAARARNLEAAGLFAGLLALSVLGFFSGTQPFLATFLRSYAPFPILVWLALRFTQREVASAVVVVTAIAALAALKDIGATSPGDMEHRLIAIELYMALTALTGFILSAVTQERRFAEKKLSQATRQMEQILDAAELGTWDWDIEKGDVVFNKRWGEMLGYQPDEVAPTLDTWSDLVHPDDMPQVQMILSAHLAGETEFYESKHRLKNKQGQWVWVLDKGQVVDRGPAGEPLRACGTHLDFTGDHLAEDAALRTVARREKEAEVVSRTAASAELSEGNVLGLAVRLTAAAAAAIEVERVGVWLFEDEGRRLVNIDTFVAGTGEHSSGAVLLEHEFKNEFDALKRSKYVDAHDAQTDPRTAGYVKGYLVPLGITSMLDSVIRSGGEILGVLCFEHVNTPKRWQDDEIAFSCQLADQIALAIAQDNRKKAEAEQERLLSAIENTGESIVITDKEGSIQYVNPAFERMTGYSRQETLGCNPRMLKSGRHDQAFFHQMWATLLTGESWTGRIVNKRKDGTFFTETAIISPLTGADGQTDGYVAAMRDITQELLLQEHYRQTQKEESIGRLAGGVAHDLNNMLSPIIGYCEILQDELGQADERRKSVDQILRAGLRARDLVAQLLAFSRKQTMEFRPLDLRALFMEFHQLLRRTIPEDVTINLVLPDEVPLVMADAGQIEQVIINLAVNAADAMPEGGDLTIGLAPVSQGEEVSNSPAQLDPGDFLVISVNDTGAGMEGAVQNKIFEPFFTTKETGKGTGLGLATVSGIVNQHGGCILVDSEPGQGTTFKVFLPVAQGALLEKAEEKKKVGVLTGSEIILIAEDNDQVRTMAEAVLNRLGYVTMTAENGHQALELLDTYEGPLHLLLADVVMPGMNGRDLFNLVVRKYPELKVLYMSGYMEDIIATRGALDPDVQFIQKPFNINALAVKVREVLDN